MYLEQLRSFCAVVDHGSFTQAARELDLTQPAVSHHVRSLERAFAVSLLVRVSKRIQPTSAGEIIYRHGTEVLAHIDAMRDAIEASKGLHGGRVVVGAGTGVGNYVLPQAIARFLHRCPDVQVDMRVDRDARIFEQVLLGLVDFGIAIGREVPSELATEPLYQDPIVLAAVPEHPIIRRAPQEVPLSALASLPIVAFSRRVNITRRLCDEWFRAVGIEPQILMECDSAEPIKRVIAEGVGAAFLYLSSIAVEIGFGQLATATVAGPPLFAQFVLARRPHQHVSLAAQAFIRSLVADLQDSRFLREVNPNAATNFARHYGGEQRP